MSAALCKVPAALCKVPAKCVQRESNFKQRRAKCRPLQRAFTAVPALCRDMFASATAFNANIGAWNTARVLDMWSMLRLYGETTFNQGGSD